MSTGAEAVPTGIQLSELDARDEQLVALVAERWPDRDHSFARRTEAVEVAVLRRLSGLAAGERAAWTARFEALAGERLALAGREVEGAAAARALASIERHHPATRAALRAATALFELAFEAGRPRQADVWLERAERHASLAGENAQSELARGLSRRRAALAPLLAAPPAEPPPWTRAREFVPAAGHPLELPQRHKPKAFARIEGQPGLAFLDRGRFAVQVTGTVWVLSPRAEDRIFEPWRLGFELGQPIATTVNHTGRDWPHLPLAAGDDLFLISGRADGAYSNLLQRVRTPRNIDLPVAVWSLGGGGLFGPDGQHEELAQVLEPGMWEFQPGPLLIEDLLLVQARQWVQVERDDRPEVATPGEARVWLLALEAGSGRVRWKRFLCRGSDCVEDFGPRFARAPLIRTPAEALAATDRGVFVGTNLGAGCMLDLADGRLLWSLRNRRRPAADAGWRTGTRSRPRLEERSGGPVLLWAPADSNELYALGPRLDFAAREELQPAPLVAFPPLPIDESELLVGGSPEQVLTLGRAGARRTLSAHSLVDGSRYDSIYLGREEEYLPGALVSPTRVLFVAEGGLYLLDRERELYLVAFHPLDVASDFASGGLWARDDELFLLAQGALLRFAIR
jgi:hypothetical protein